MRTRNLIDIRAEKEMENLAIQLSSTTWYWIAGMMKINYPYSLESKIKVLKRIKRKFGNDGKACMDFFTSRMPVDRSLQDQIEPNG